MQTLFWRPKYPVTRPDNERQTTTRPARCKTWQRWVLLMFATGVCACSRRQPPESRQWLCMGTAAAVSAPAGQHERLERVRQTVSDVFAAVENDLSIFRAGSVVTAINAAAGTDTMTPINAHAAQVIGLALEAAATSNGAFDPTVGPLMTLWGFRGTPVAHPPTTAAITAVRECVGWRHVQLDTSRSDAPTASLSRPGMHLDLGGIAKGYAVDLAYDRLREVDESDFLINLGGNIRACGVPGAGRDGWRVGVRDPYHNNDLLGMLTLHNGEAVATSGNYERFVVLDGVRYAHIIDPRSGRPIIGVAGVTVVAPTATQADALSTALFVLGPEEGLKLLKQTPDCHVLWVLDDAKKNIIFSPGLEVRFTPLPEHH